MAGIKNIRDLYKKVGEKGLREVLEGEIRVTEKFDAYRFAFEKNPHDYKIYFYGKNGKTPLSKIDRTVSDLYEAAIASIENLPAEVKKAIPPRHRFGFSWFPTNSPLNTEYERRPKRGLVLTDITIRNRERDVTRDVKEPQVFERWSSIFGVEANTPIHEGRLDEKTVDSLIEMAKNEYNLTSLNESSVHTYGLLNESTANIEALIFEAEGQLFKVADKEEKDKVVEKRSHVFDILLLDICEFLNESQLEEIKPVSLHTDEAYVEVVSEIFNNYVESRGKSFLASGMEKPKFLEKSGSFNRSWVKNPKTLAIIENDKSYEYLYTVFLTNLKKPKYASGLLSEAVVNTFNSQIEEISRICEDDYSFLEFSNIPRESAIYEEVPVLAKNVKDKDKKEDAPHVANVEKAVLLLHSFFNQTGKKSQQELVDVLVINGAMPSNKVVQEAERLNRESGLKVLIVHNQQQDKLGVEEEVVAKMLSLLVDDNREIVEGYAVLKMPTLSSILTSCKTRYPRKISCNLHMSDVLQMEMVSHQASKGSEARPFKVEAHGDRLYKDCLGSLDRGEIAAFKKCMPSNIHSYWNSLKSAYDKQNYY